MAKLPCRRPACGALVTRADKGFCAEHAEYRNRWRNVSKEYSATHYGWQWKKLRKQVVNRDNGICQACLKQGIYQPGTEVDHIIDKRDGGTDDMDNLQLLCKPHHSRKTGQAGARHRLGRAEGWGDV